MLRELSATRAGRLVVGALALLLVAVLAGMALLWPSGDPGFDAIIAGSAERAKVERVAAEPCALSQRGPCQLVTARLETGPDRGRSTTLSLPGTDFAPEVEGGDVIRVVANEGAEEAYAFSDFERRTPLYLLAVLFAIAVIAFGRWKGVRSLVGLAVSLAIVTQFMVPAILDGGSPVLVALVGALAVMLVTVLITHGTGVTSLAAIAGAATSLLVTALLALLFVELAHVTGFSSEQASLLTGGAGADGGQQLSLQGLVLAGIVIGALGVLDDVTVSQASTVLALRRADPAQGPRRLYTGAIGVGRDHLSATVNTLVLAYVGAALPILLIFESQATSFGEALNREVVAAEVVAMLVGSIGLVLAVPLTTAIAAWLASHLPHAVLARAGDAHAHHHH